MFLTDVAPFIPVTPTLKDVRKTLTFAGTLTSTKDDQVKWVIPRTHYNSPVTDPCVKSVFIIHVVGTRCVTSSTDNIMKIHARITLTVECIRGYIFLFLFYV